MDLALASTLGRTPFPAFRRMAKRRAELGYWKARSSAEGGLRGTYYERFFTDYFGLTRSDYDGKRVLDIGCGPRGSLEWATNALERVGLDPLARDYEKLNGRSHAMSLVAGVAERIPFPDGHFDVIASFNSLDHVDDLARAIAEIGRVAAPGARLLLLTDVNHEPTFTEPQSFGWEILSAFAPAWSVVSSKRVKKSGAGMMEDLNADVRVEEAHRGPGYLAALLERSP